VNWQSTLYESRTEAHCVPRFAKPSYIFFSAFDHGANFAVLLLERAQVLPASRWPGCRRAEGGRPAASGTPGTRWPGLMSSLSMTYPYSTDF
jgi:hypothetical protein